MVKKLTLTIILLLALAVPGWGANYFVSTSGSNTSPHNTWAKAATDLSGIVDHLSGGGNNIYIDGSTFSITANTDIYKVGTSGAYNSIIGSSGGVDDGTGHFGIPGLTVYELSGYNGTAITTTGAGTDLYLNISGIRFQNSAANANYCIDSNTGNGLNIFDCIFRDVATAIRMRGINNNVYRNSFEGSKYNNSMVRIEGANSTGSLYDNIFKGSLTNLLYNAIINTSNSNNHTGYNNVVIGGVLGQMYCTAAGGTLALRNNCCIGATTAPPLTYTAGTISDYNNLWLPAGGIPVVNNITGSTYTGGSLQNQHPRLKSMPFIGYLFMGIDDNNQAPFAYDIASKIYNPRGQKIMLNLTTWQNVVDNAALQNFVNNGNDVSCHSRSHPEAITSLHALQIKSSRTNPRVTIQNTQNGDSTTWTGSITLKADGDADLVITFDGTEDSPSKRMNRFICGIVPWINTQTGWTCQAHADSGPFSKGVCLADCTNTAVNNATWTTFDHDSVEFYKVELIESKAIIESWIRTGAMGRAATYELKLFTPPNNVMNDAVRDLLAAAGFKACRGALDIYNDFTHSKLKNLYPYQIPLYQHATLFMGDAALPTGSHTGSDNPTIMTDSAASLTPNAYIGKIISNLNDKGCSGIITANTATTVTAILSGGLINSWKAGNTYRIADPLLISRNSSALSLMNEANGLVNIVYENWTHDEHDYFSRGCVNSNYANLKIGINDWIDMVWGGTASPDGNGWTVGAGSIGSPDHLLRFDHTFVDLSDFRLRPGSPGINNAVGVGLTRDFAGNPVPNKLRKYSIGPYEYDLWGGGRGMMGMGLGVGQ